MFSLTETSGLFLTKFQARSANHYNSQNLMDGRIKKRYDFTGKQMNIETQLSFSGGVGAKLLPVANTSIVEQAVITAKKNYARCFVDRESLKAASSTEGAFQKFMAYPVKKTVESFNRNSNRILFGDGTGILGRGDGATNVTGAGTTGNPYIVTLRVSDWNVANFEEQDYIQTVTGLGASDNLGGTAEGGDNTTNLLLIQEVVPSARQLKLVGTSAVLAALAGVGPLLTTTGFCMQRSYLAEPMGLRGACMATSGSLYGVTVKRRWQSQQEDASGQGVVTDMINDMVLKVEKAVGIPPKVVITNYNQIRKILAQLEDQKVYNLPNKNLKGHIGFDGIQIMTSRGAIGLFADRMCDEDKMYFLNEEFISRYHRPDFGWFDDDGTVFLRTPDDEDSYEARYGGYYENLIDPTFQGVLYNLEK
jgi:hypothetical protein